MPVKVKFVLNQIITVVVMAEIMIATAVILLIILETPLITQVHPYLIFN
jgi:hypothetical protein